MLSLVCVCCHLLDECVYNWSFTHMHYLLDTTLSFRSTNSNSHNFIYFDMNSKAEGLSMCVKVFFFFSVLSPDCPLSVSGSSLQSAHLCSGGPSAGHYRSQTALNTFLLKLCFLHSLLFYLLPLKTLKVLLLETDTVNCRLLTLGLHWTVLILYMCLYTGTTTPLTVMTMSWYGPILWGQSQVLFECGQSSTWLQSWISLWWELDSWM